MFPSRMHGRGCIRVGCQLSLVPVACLSGGRVLSAIAIVFVAASFVAAFKILGDAFDEGE